MKSRASNSLKSLTPRGISTRQRIIEATARLAYANGVESISLDDVLDAASVSKSQLYHYFSDKDGLIREVITAQTAGVLAAQEPALGQIESLIALHRWRDAILALYEQTGGTGGCPLGSLANTLANQSEPSRERLVLGFNAWADRLGEGFARMQANGALQASAVPKDLALAVLGAVQGGLLLAKTFRARKPLEVTLNMALEMVEKQCVPGTAGSTTATGRSAKEAASRDRHTLRKRRRFT